ncbi:UBP38 hydrolase, partial [Cinclus mexicanus]|nr:UBP38 hydrolase [Cinclus mexicanus]
DMPKPTEEKIKLILSQSAWTSQSSSLPSCLSRLSGKSETGKTGLINLGNTCYMNSVIQALFMATDFRRHVLSLNLNGCNSLMRKLQHLFAFLAHTQVCQFSICFSLSLDLYTKIEKQTRCHGSPLDYLDLFFFVFRLHEEERTLKALSSAKSSESIMTDESQAQEAVHKTQVFTEAPHMGSEERTLIEKMFGGKLKTNICCLNCKSMSQKEEAFTDLSLAFCPPTSLENVDPKCMEHSEVKDDYMVQSNTLATSPATETPLSNLEVNRGCDTIMNEGTIEDFSSEPGSENTTISELKVENNGDMSQSLVGKNTLSVTDLLNYFLAPEILSGDNKYYCEKCASLQNAEKTMQIIEEPEYLILTLLRFSYDPKCHIRRKILDNVSLPLVLELPVKRAASPLAVVSGGWSVGVEISDTGENLAKKLKPSGADEVTCPQLVPYVLSSVVVHSGVSSESGHYYSYARNVTGSGPSGFCHQSTALSLVSPQDKLFTEESPCTVVENELDTEMPREWFLFNDSRVTFTSFQSVQKITSRFPKDTAYVLFYKKQNSACGFNTNPANGLWVNGDPPLQKDLMDAITKDNKLYLQEQELSARTQALQAASASCSFRPNGFDDNDPPGSCGPTGGGGGGGFSTVGRLVF